MRKTTTSKPWLKKILENAKKDVESWPDWLQKLRDGNALDQGITPKIKKKQKKSHEKTQSRR